MGQGLCTVYYAWVCDWMEWGGFLNDLDTIQVTKMRRGVRMPARQCLCLSTSVCLMFMCLWGD